MNVRDAELEALLAEWLEDDQSVAPAAPVEAAVSFARTHPRRRDWLAFARGDAMTSPSTTRLRPVAIAIALVVLLVAAVGGAALIASRPEATPTPSATPTIDLTHLPPTIPDFALAAAGEYTMRGPSSGVTAAGWPSVVIANLPAGWTQNSSARGSGLLKPSLDKPQAELSMWSVGNVSADGCPVDTLSQDAGLMSPSVGPSVEELAAALRALPTISATAPVTAAVGGFGAVRLNLMVPDQVRCDFFRLWISPPDNGERWSYASRAGWLHRIWIVDVDGLRFLVDAASAPDAPAELLGELDQMVSSIEIVP